MKSFIRPHHDLQILSQRYYHDRKYFTVTGSNFTTISEPLLHNRSQQGLGAVYYLVLLALKHTENMFPSLFAAETRPWGLLRKSLGWFTPSPANEAVSENQRSLLLGLAEW